MYIACRHLSPHRQELVLLRRNSVLSLILGMVSCYQFWSTIFCEPGSHCPCQQELLLLLSEIYLMLGMVSSYRLLIRLLLE
jgi:hypothetical protein